VTLQVLALMFFLILPLSAFHIFQYELLSFVRVLPSSGCLYTLDDYVKGSFSGSVYESETNDPVDIDGTFLIKELLVNKKIREFLCRNYS